MASKVLVPAAPFTKLQLKKQPLKDSPGLCAGTVGGGGAEGAAGAARVAHLEHSVRFLQEQHRLMLSGLHAEIEALRERNRDLQFQLIFNKESSPKISPSNDDGTESNEMAELRRAAAAARGAARASDARALSLQRELDEQAEKLRELEIKKCSVCAGVGASGGEAGEAAESRAELRARLTEAERLVRRLRGDGERQRREVPTATAGHTNLLFDRAAAQVAHLQCMKNSLRASLRASGLEAPAYGYQHNYHFPPVAAAEFWREPLRDDHIAAAAAGGGRRRAALPELSGAQLTRSTTGYANVKTSCPSCHSCELQCAVAKKLKHCHVAWSGEGGGGGGRGRRRARRHHTDHT